MENVSTFEDDLIYLVSKGYRFRSENIRFPVLAMKSVGVGELNLSARAMNAIKRVNIATVGELIDRAPMISGWRNVGKGTAKEIKNEILRFSYERMTAGQRKQFWMNLADPGFQRPAEEGE